VPSKQDNVSARLAAQWREPQLPEHRARHRVAHRSGHGREDLAPASTSTTPAWRAPRVRSLGNYLFVALETSREVAVVDVQGWYEIFRFDVGRAPQGLAISNDGAACT
jgi:hypothetical protein